MRQRSHLSQDGFLFISQRKKAQTFTLVRDVSLAGLGSGGKQMALCSKNLGVRSGSLKFGMIPPRINLQSSGMLKRGRFHIRKQDKTRFLFGRYSVRNVEETIWTATALRGAHGTQIAYRGKSAQTEHFGRSDASARR